jgi:hypothetical protein
MSPSGGGRSSVTTRILRSRLAALVLSAALVLVACSPAGVQILSFGTGGTGCEVATVAKTFAVGQPMRMTASFSPTPTHVTIDIKRDGAVDPHSGQIDLGGEDNCVTAEFDDLVPGHYLVKLTPTPAAGVPPLTGEFDVTP